MNIQYIKRIDEIEYKQSDIIFCYLGDVKQDAEGVFGSSLTAYLSNLSTELNSLIFAYFTLTSGREAPRGAVGIFVGGSLLDIYVENDIEQKFNLSTYHTRLGKVGILINCDIFSSNIFYALALSGVDLILAFVPELLKAEVHKQAHALFQVKQPQQHPQLSTQGQARMQEQYNQQQKQTLVLPQAQYQPLTKQQKQVVIQPHLSPAIPNILIITQATISAT